MTNTLIKSTLAAGLIAASTGFGLAGETSTEIALTYVWTAHDGQAERLVETYQEVGEIIEAKEPGLLQ
ncbi:MAG: hypothetical protein NXH88_01750 [Hyphomonas sp.]|nr:hypothetical protein [Hyphomonas sp.]